MKMKTGTLVRYLCLSSVMVALAVGLAGCSTEKVKNRAKESAARYWSDKAYPGKSYDVQVIEAEKDSDGNYRVKGIVDGETRVGTFSPESETFSEGYYSLAHEREKRIAELEQEVKYWKEKAEAQDKEIYKLKFQVSNLKNSEDAEDSSVKPASVAAPAATPAATDKK